MSLNFKEITLRYEGHCLLCKVKMMPGETALWTSRVGIKHKNCDSGLSYGDKWSESNPFENINKHSDNFYRMKAWRDSF